jgi:hypothetical protein
MFLCRLLNSSTPEQKANILQYHLGYDPQFLTDALQEGPYDYVYYTEVYRDAEAGQELPFEDDGFVDGPNAAWPWSMFIR